MQKKPWHPTKRELDVINILWASEKSMTALEIVKTQSDLTINTVQAVLRKLLKQGVIEVAEIVYSGTVLTRSYKPALTQSEFAATQFMEDLDCLNTSISKTSLLAALLKKETNKEKALQEIKELEAMLDNYKRNL